MEKRCGACLWHLLLLLLLLLQGLCCKWCCGQKTEDGFREMYLNGTGFVLLECGGKNLRYVDILAADNSTELVSWFRDEAVCKVNSTNYGACDINPDADMYSAKLLITDLKKGEKRKYHCVIATNAKKSVTNRFSVEVIYKEPPTTTLAPKLTTEPVTPGDDGTQTAAASGGNGGFPGIAGYVIVVALVIVVIICTVLGYVICRQKLRKRKQAVDPDNLSLRSGIADKSFYYTTQAASRAGNGARGGEDEMAGMGMEVLQGYPVRSLSTPAPSTAAPGFSAGKAMVMEYQSPFNPLPVPAGTLTLSRGDARRNSAGKVYYHEPWSTISHDQHTLPHFSAARHHTPNPRLVRIPNFDTTAEPLSVPPPTQETWSEISEGNV